MPPNLQYTLQGVIIAIVIHDLLARVGLLDSIDPGVYIVILAGIRSIELIWSNGPPRFLITEVVITLQRREMITVGNHDQHGQLLWSVRVGADRLAALRMINLDGIAP